MVCVVVKPELFTMRQLNAWIVQAGFCPGLTLNILVKMQPLSQAAQARPQAGMQNA